MDNAQQKNIILATIRARAEQDRFCDEARIFRALSKVDDNASLAKTQRLIRELHAAGKVIRGSKRYARKGCRLVGFPGDIIV